ncbi:hypothetical protein RUND412_010196 [Rhizina undulata]
MPFSHHSHSGEFCKHAKGSLEQMIQTAIEKGMRVYSLTEHMPRDQAEDLYEEEVNLGLLPFDLFRTFDEFYNCAIHLRAQYGTQIQLLVGCEIDYIRESSIPLVQHLRKTYRFDFFIGSVHHVNAIPIDFNKDYYLKAIESVGGSEEALFEAYFDAQYEMLRKLQPPVIGHFDLIKLLCADPTKPLRDYGEVVWQKAVRNIEYIAGYRGLLELNSASLRKGWETPYPQPDVCQVAAANGVRFVLSDDSHEAYQVGLNYHRVLQYIEHLGFDHIHYLEKLPMGEIAVDTQEACAVRKISLEDLKREPFWRLSVEGGMAVAVSQNSL